MRKKSLAAILLALTLILNITPAFNALEVKQSTLNGAAIDTIQGVANSASFTYENESQMLSDMSIAAENDAFILYYNKNTLAIALYNKKNGSVYTSNPYNAAQDPYFAGEIKNNLISQVVINYIDDKNQSAALWSGPDCAQLGQYTIRTYKNGLVMDLSIGKEQKKMLVPAALTKKRYTEITAKLSSRASRRMNLFYSLISINNVQDPEEKKRLLADFPILKSEPLYICNDTVSQKEKAEIDEYMQGIYTNEQYESDSKKFNIQSDQERFPNFKLSIEYSLTDDGIKVTIPNNSVSYDKQHYQLFSIRLLEYFGADKPSETGNGYLFIPDGSGSIISFNNQSPNRRLLMTGRVYGTDGAVKQNENSVEGEQYYLPVFGIVRNNKTALFSIIERGDTESEITSKLGQPNSQYYTVYNTFLWTTQEFIVLEPKVASNGSARRLYLYDKNVCKSDLTISYHCLYGADANYSKMAQVYRNYLIQHGMQEKKEISAVNFNLQTIGTAQYKASFFGFPYKTDAKFTKYSDNEKIINYFLNVGIKNVHLTLKGFMKNGLDSGISNRVVLSNALGGKTDFKQLQDYCTQKSIDFATQSNMLFVNRDHLFDGFSVKNNSSRTLTKINATIADLQPDTLKYEYKRYCISPKDYEKYFNGFFKDAKKLHINRVNLGDIGKYLNSDFNEHSAYNRDETKDLLQRLLSAYSKDSRLSFDGANAYVFPFAYSISNLVMSNSGYMGETAAVPFVQLVLSGCINYSSEPINLKADKQKELLNCIASGTSPTYLLAYTNIDKIKLTNYSSYYAIDFNYLKDSVLTSYKYVRDALSSTSGTRLVSHEILANGVVLSKFENGTKIAVNFNDNDFSDGLTTVKARSYTVLPKENAHE